MMRGWTKKLYEVLASDQEYKKRRELKDKQENEMVMRIEPDVNQRYLTQNSEKYAYLKNFGLGFQIHDSQNLRLITFCNLF